MSTPRFPGSIAELAAVGNISGNVPERHVVPYGHSIMPGLILKGYILREEDKRFVTQEDMIAVLSLIENEYRIGAMPQLSGIGFFIASAEILSTYRWDNGYIDVVVPKMYTPKNRLWTPQSVEEVGAFCSGEKRVYDHEMEAWKRFIGSKRTADDKVVYLNNFLKE